MTARGLQSETVRLWPYKFIFKKEGEAMRRIFGVFFACALAMVVVLPGASYAKKPDPTAQCQSKKVNAATIFVKKLFYAQAAFLKNPEFDLDGAVTEAEAQFQARWDAAEASDECDFPFGQDIDIPSDPGNPVNFADVGQLMDWIEGEVDGIATLIMDGVDDLDKDSVNLGAELLRAAGQKGFSLLKAEAQNLQKPNDAKRNRARVKAMNKYGNTYEQRVRKAEQKGVDVTYFQEDSDPADGTEDVLADSEAGIDSLVEDIVTIFTAQQSL